MEQQFSALNESEEASRERFFEKRKELLEKYLKLRKRTDKLLQEQSEIWEDLTKANKAICDLEGHRLSKHLEHDLTEKDVVVQDNDELTLESMLRK